MREILYFPQYTCGTGITQCVREGKVLFSGASQRDFVLACALTTKDSLDFHKKKWLEDSVG